VWPFVIETGLSYSTGYNLWVNMCALVFSPWICGFGPFTKKHGSVMLSMCVWERTWFMFCLGDLTFSYSVIHESVCNTISLVLLVLFVSICIDKYMQMLGLYLWVCAFRSWWMNGYNTLKCCPGSFCVRWRSCLSPAAVQTMAPHGPTLHLIQRLQKEGNDRVALTPAQLHTCPQTRPPLLQTYK